MGKFKDLIYLLSISAAVEAYSTKYELFLKRDIKRWNLSYKNFLSIKILYLRLYLVRIKIFKYLNISIRCRYE
jgi:hypothetical protein